MHDTTPPPTLKRYERQKALRVQKNNEVYYALNLSVLSVRLRNFE